MVTQIYKCTSHKFGGGSPLNLAAQKDQNFGEIWDVFATNHSRTFKVNLANFGPQKCDAAL